MCFKTFYGFTCGHTSACFLVKCPLTLQNDVFPPCSIPGTHQIFANQFCHGCMRCVWNKEVIIEEEAHRGRHERDECHCEIIFDRDERERRVRERELLAIESSLSASGNAQGRQRGRGRVHGAAGRSAGVNGAGTTDKGADKDGGEGRQGESRQIEEGAGDNSMMRGWNGGFMMSPAPSGYPSPRPNDPASFHPYFEYANNKYMGAGQLDNNGHGNPLGMNPVTGVIPGIPISSPPPVTSTSEWHEGMMVIPRSPQMNSFGAYPMAESTARRNASMAPPTCTYLYQGNYYTWTPNPELNAAAMDHPGAASQQKAQNPTPTGFTDQFSYQNQHQINHDAQRNAHNYPQPPSPPPSRSPHGQPPNHWVFHADTEPARNLWPRCRHRNDLAPLRLLLATTSTSSPCFKAPTTASAAPNHFIGSAAVVEHDARNAQQNIVQGSATKESIGQINMQAPTVITTNMAPKDFYTTQATNQGRAPMRYDATGQATTQGQCRIESEDTPHSTTKINNLNKEPSTNIANSK
ncbi:hypothetical protein EYC84_002666 [Monilinia fructicola]|uniref:Uncharacterized protein n=1 Tax=Monilinia fructicola TaxID=38448 RepID=A0A5M9JLM2_MONFR|nr:hypothetical protein EYC84_002666 [Monilinia fructicola]